MFAITTRDQQGRERILMTWDSEAAARRHAEIIAPFYEDCTILITVKTKGDRSVLAKFKPPALRK